eukprot:3007323-Amphidinium_carterae.1
MPIQGTESPLHSGEDSKQTVEESCIYLGILEQKGSGTSQSEARHRASDEEVLFYLWTNEDKGPEGLPAATLTQQYTPCKAEDCFD